MAALAVTLSSSWLGTLVFASDRTNDRIQFLADRGVSASLTWWTRQGIPLALLSVTGTLLAIIAVCTRQTHELEQLHNSGAQIPLMMVALSLVSGALAYIASQWLAQAVPSPIITAICGPVFAAMLIGYFGFLGFEIGAPIWLLTLVSLIPLVTTYALMARWMEGRLDWTFWVGHAACLLACILLPFVPLGLVLQRPSMSGETARVLAAEAARWPDHGWAIPPGLGMKWGTREESYDLVTGQMHEQVFDDATAEVSDLQQQLQRSQGPVSANPAHIPIPHIADDTRTMAASERSRARESRIIPSVPARIG